MNLTVILVCLGLAGVVWWAIGVVKKTHNPNRVDDSTTHGGASENQQQPGRAFDTTTYDNPNADPNRIIIRLNVDTEEVLRSRREWQENRIKWSGRPYGAFPIKRFTDPQWACICSAVGRKRIVSGNPYTHRGDTPADVALHPAQTVNSMVKHGFIESDGTGAFVCTDFGAKAYEQLPYF